MAELTALAESLARSEFPALLKQLGLAGRAEQGPRRRPGARGRRAAARSIGPGGPLRRGAVAARGDPRRWRVAGAAGGAGAGLRTARHALRVPVEPGAPRLQGPRHALRRAAAGARPEIGGGPAQPGPSSGRWSAATTWPWPTSTRRSSSTRRRRTATPAPSWLPVIDAYLKSDRKRLAIKDGPHARLAALLSMMVGRVSAPDPRARPGGPRRGEPRCRLLPGLRRDLRATASSANCTSRPWRGRTPSRRSSRSSSSR